MSSAKRSHLAGWLTGKGIELGALHQPLAVPPGVEVEYVDRLSVADLRRQYPELAALDLVPVAHIGSAENLADVTDSSMDFVVACHVLEHIEDPTRALREIHRVLRDGGIFFCALPEPRVTFDRERQPTTMEHLVRDHADGSTSRREHFVDWVENVERHQPWWATDRPDPEERVQLLLEMDYSIHFHVWRPDTFVDYLGAVRRRDGIEFELLDFAGCEPGVDDEFIFILRKGVAPVPVTAPSLTRPWTGSAPASGAVPAAHPQGARQAVREAVRAGRVAAASVRAAGQRRLQRARSGH
ncbi:MAG: class I SAM-dependent methyltransferase [Candidatus Dormibacteraeota bacterium]|uniref:Class I SAM-dependent methyltransferase n=1 Tax=Candidatus Aeolococcus gillhamiae TaxID=3127015 RepID=A0A2W6ARQ5_9BACT|nr:class I SAM-dependent methyltransferase [Candidatus Dormibacteraeota bacterium]PZR80481.1 MAG: methyltransferase type 11 [Candidatus Dormibacter sp. RRmetagenome_bin12]